MTDAEEWWDGMSREQKNAVWVSHHQQAKDSCPASCPPERTEALKRAVSAILMDAVNGSNPDYRLPEEEGGFIRWGRVEEVIHATIECSLQPKKTR